MFQLKIMVSIVTHWFTPHYTNNHRPKVLQPMGLSVVVAVFLMVQTSLQLMRLSPAIPGGFVLGYASSISSSEVVELTNIEREKIGLSPLTVNAKLSEAATAKAAHMFQHDYWAHIAPDGTSPWTFIKHSGYAYTVAGENLARDFSDSASMVQAWMNSPTHKDNIVHKKYTEIGIAVVNGKLGGVETTLVVQMFGTPTTAVARTSESGARSDRPVAQKPVEDTEVKILEVNQLEPAPPPIQAEVLSSQAQPKKHLISPLTVTKVTASGLIIMLVLVLTYDAVFMSKKNLPRKTGNNLAHLGLFTIILLIIFAVSQGKVL